MRGNDAENGKECSYENDGRGTKTGRSEYRTRKRAWEMIAAKKLAGIFYAVSGAWCVVGMSLGHVRHNIGKRGFQPPAKRVDFRTYALARIRFSWTPLCADWAFSSGCSRYLFTRSLFHVGASHAPLGFAAPGASAHSRKGSASRTQLPPSPSSTMP